jgi:hypothetical protein
MDSRACRETSMDYPRTDDVYLSDTVLRRDPAAGPLR